MRTEEKRPEGNGQSGEFDRDEFDRVFDQSNIEDSSSILNHVGYSRDNIVYSAVMKVWKEQFDNGCNNISF